MTTNISEHTMYQVHCETCGGLSRFFLSMHAAERWQTTHAETHTGDSELQKVNARLVWHNTQLTQELEDESNARAAALAQRDEARADAEQLRADLLKAHGRTTRKKTEPVQW